MHLIALILLSTIVAYNFTANNKLVVGVQRCRNSAAHHASLQFSLVRPCQRSQWKTITFANTQTLEECMNVTRNARGLALNYAPLSRRHLNKDQENQQLNKSAVYDFTFSYNKRRQYFWQQPEEFFNCHVLACPENSTFHSMVNDRRFDYFSLYGEAIAPQNYTCLPEVGLFQLHSTPQTFLNASKTCANFSTTEEYQRGSLAHVASTARTNAFSMLLSTYNENKEHGGIHLAYVGLHFNRSSLQPLGFYNSQNEPLNCYMFVAWAPGNPKLSEKYINISCVAITPHRTWVSVQCDRKLPFICEIYTSSVLDNGFTFANVC